MNLIRVGLRRTLVVKNVRYSSATNQKTDELSVFHREKKVIGYSREMMFDIVKDVASYKDFVPFCLDSVIIQKEKQIIALRRGNKANVDAQPMPKTFKAQLTVGFPPLRESYVSTVTYVQYDFIKTLSQNTSVFEYIAAEWTFSELDSRRNADVAIRHIDDKSSCCAIDFNVSFRFNSVIYSRFSSVFLDKIFKQMVGAFEKRAKDLYGPNGLLKN
jgi:coenzyme Q-binding protein COQ10